MSEPYLRSKAAARDYKFLLAWPEKFAIGMPEAPLWVSQAPEQAVVLQRVTAKVLMPFERVAAQKKEIALEVPLVGTVAAEYVDCRSSHPRNALSQPLALSCDR